MIDRTPTPRDQRGPLPAFEPVPRKPRHDGWTPERQVAFIEALADTGSVTRAAAQVNMSAVGAYYLRRQPGGEGFARAWEAALDMGVLRLKDEAFDRAMNGQLVPVIAGGKLIGYRRQRNDRLIMFVLRHYGPNPQPSGLASARARRDHPREQTSAAAIVEAFAGLDLDEEAQAQILAILTAGAARARALMESDNDADDPAIAFVHPRRPRTRTVTPRPVGHRRAQERLHPLERITRLRPPGRRMAGRLGVKAFRRIDARSPGDAEPLAAAAPAARYSSWMPIAAR